MTTGQSYIHSTFMNNQYKFFKKLEKFENCKRMAKY